MRLFVKGAGVIALALLANVSAAAAQGVELSLGGGLSSPLGTFNDATKLGWNGLAAITVLPAGSPVGIQVDGEYQQFPFDGFSGHERFLIGTGNLVYRFNTSENSAVRPYLIGGGGVYNFKGTGSSTLSGNFSTSGSTTKFGVNGVVDLKKNDDQEINLEGDGAAKRQPPIGISVPGLWRYRLAASVGWRAWEPSLAK